MVDKRGGEVVNRLPSLARTLKYDMMVVDFLQGFLVQATPVFSAVLPKWHSITVACFFHRCSQTPVHMVGSLFLYLTKRSLSSC